MGEPEEVVNVEILGQQYAIRSSLDAAYIADLAAYVEQKMRAAGEATPNSDILRLAVLTALNLADELFRCRQSDRMRSTEVADRATALEKMLDQALR